MKRSFSSFAVVNSLSKYVTVTLFISMAHASTVGAMNKVTVTATGRESDKFMLRLPDGMRDQIATAAKAGGRSMNSEIVARLQDSFASAPPSPYPTITVELDSTGYPISWDEVSAILRRIRLDGKLNAVSMNTSVYTPELVSSSVRQDQVGRLEEMLNRMRIKASSDESSR